MKPQQSLQGDGDAAPCAPMPTTPPDARRRRLLQALGAAGAAGLAGPAPLAAAPGAARVALVLGNAAYADAPLLNPVRDARAVAALLARQGFEVITAHDADRARMHDALRRTGQALRGRQGVALLYYAGHGLQIDWRNYMLPVDVRIASAADVPRLGLDVQAVLETFRAAGTRTNILVLDACRDNPFGSSGGPRGLAPMDAPAGTFFAYATAPGNVAEDGTEADGNGLYTRFLLQELGQPGARIEDVFKRVRLHVRRATAGRQTPWESTSLEEDFVFATGQKVQAPDAGEREREFAAERAAWERIRDSQRPEDFYAFLQRHPSGPLAELAQFALDRLARPVVVAQAPQALQVAVLPSGVDRYRLGDAWVTLRIDHKNGGAETKLPRRVTGIDGQVVQVNGGRILLDQMGMIILNGSGRKDPGILAVPASLQVGKRWRSAFTNTPSDGRPREHSHYDHHVVGLEEVEVPAGRFRAFRIEQTGQAIRPGSTSRLEVQVWVDPATMWVLRLHQRFTALHGGWVDVDETFDLVSMNRVPR
jgi:Caspase domain